MESNVHENVFEYMQDLFQVLVKNEHGQLGNCAKKRSLFLQYKMFHESVFEGQVRNLKDFETIMKTGVEQWMELDRFMTSIVEEGETERKRTAEFFKRKAIDVFRGTRVLDCEKCYDV